MCGQARPGLAGILSTTELQASMGWCLAYSTASCILVHEARPTAAVGAPISQVGAVKTDPDTL